MPTQVFRISKFGRSRTRSRGWKRSGGYSKHSTAANGATLMKFGVQVRATAEGVDLGWIARELEARGFESLFLPEHTHVPVERDSAHPGGENLMDAAMRGY